MNRIKLYSIFILLMSILSCNKYKKFYKENQVSLKELAAKSFIQISDIGFCCEIDECFDISTINLMRSLGIVCIRKDTTDKTLNFIFKQKEILRSSELIYLYDTTYGIPKSYPKAGEKIEKISDTWFARKIQFD